MAPSWFAGPVVFARSGAVSHRDAPTPTALTRRVTSPASLRDPAQEQASVALLREAGEVADGRLR